jgi:uncharacterized membrane protein
MRGHHPDERPNRISLGLGLFSIGLGMAELLAPRTLIRSIGVRDDDTSEAALRACGVREIANGVAILAQPDRARWLWARVGGDGIDLALLGSAIRSADEGRTRGTAAAAAVIGVTALDILAAQHLSAPKARAWGRSPRAVRVEKAVTINRPIEQAYKVWRDFENLPRFMRHLEAVEILSDTRSRWRAKAPGGLTVEWEAEILEDRPDEWIAWRSLEGSGVRNSGSVRFARAPGARGTEVRVQVQYEPPAGAAGRSIAWLFGEEPEQQIADDLRRFKQMLEAGEIPVSDGPGLWRPAQPAERPETLKALAGVRE